MQKNILLKRMEEKQAAISSVSKQRAGLKQKMSNAEDAFGIEVDDGSEKPKSKMSRNKRDSKFGFGGKKNNKRAKSNDTASFLEGRFNINQNKALPKHMQVGRHPPRRGFSLRLAHWCPPAARVGFFVCFAAQQRGPPPVLHTHPLY